MKKITFILLCLAWLFPFVLWAQTATKPAGSGTIFDPYQIANLNNLYWVTQNSSSWDKYFVQTADIDASATSSWNNNAGFTPIGNYPTYFTGHYNGESHSISNLCINQSINQASNVFLGMFGYTSGAIIQKVVLTNVNVTGSGTCGGLIGEADNTTVSKCSSSGTVSGNNYAIGGLIGVANYDTIQNCYSAGVVNANTNGYGVGGLIGVFQDANLSQSYSTCTVNGSSQSFGGLIGTTTDNAVVSNCYAVGDVKGSDQVGGLIGWINSNSTISNCYSTGKVTGGSNLGGLIGTNSSSTVSHSFWDTETSGMTTSSGGTGKTTTDMKTQSTFTDAGWDFSKTWAIQSGTNNGYPHLLMYFIPIISTVQPFNIGTDSAQAGGSFLISGNSVTASGIVWNTTNNPTLTDYMGKTDDGTVGGSFTSTLKGLSDTTLYYVRAYAGNSNGTGYGKALSFTTKMAAPPALSAPGNALSFDGTDDYVILGNESNFDFEHAMTVAAWIKVDTFTTAWQAIVTKGDGSWRLQRYNTTNFIDFGTSGLSNADLEGKTNVNDGKWHYIAGVYDGSKKYLYVDGTLDTAVSVTNVIWTSDDAVEIGANSAASGRNFDGLIDEVRIWNVARTPSEILDNMNNPLTGHETGLVGYYKFDMPSGTWLYDHTGNGNTGRLHNMNNSDWVAAGWPVFYAHAVLPGGTGTSADPYQINTLDNLYWVSQNDTAWGRYFIQTANINASRTRKWKNGTGFPPIGNSSKNFTGHYDGQGYSIDSLFIDQNAHGENIGLFGYTNNAVIQQLALNHENIKAYYNIGGLIGNANQTSVFNCHTSGNVLGSYIGGLIGAGNEVTLLNCYSSDTVRSNYGGGGLVGTLQNSIIKQSYSACVITNNNGSSSYVGGLVGISGNLTGNVDNNVISNCYNTGPVDGSSQVGGLIGANRQSLVSYCYSTGKVTGSSDVGGLIGFKTGGSITASFWDTETSGLTTSSGGGTGKTTAEMKAQSTFTDAGWDFTNTWAIQSGTNNGYPYLLMKNILVVTTVNPSNIGIHTAYSGGMVTGGEPLTAEGVVWDITNNPTVANHLGITNDGTAQGTFTSTLTGLNDTTVYYFRAYATNNDGTEYGDVKSFTTLMSAPAIMAPPGHALDFDGTNDYVSLPYENDFDFTSAMTVAAWIKVDTFTTDWQAIVTKGDGSWRLQRFGSTNHIDFGTNGLSNGDLEGTTDVNDGNWHYIAGVFDGSTKYLYVDGKLDASASVTGTISTNNYPVEIGANSGAPGRNFDGLIDEVRIWNVARTQTELKDNMNTVLTGNESGLTAYYKFDMSSGTYLYDHSGNNHTGKLHNMANSDWVGSGWPEKNNATWTGNVSTDWNDSGNWSGITGLPADTVNIDIPNVANQPVIQPGDTAECHNLIIESGATLTLASDATGNGELILKGSEAGDVTVQRYIAGYTSASNGWHTVAAPFDMTVSTANFQPGASDDLYKWNETTFQWDNYKANHFNFSRGKGYLVSYGNTAVHNMTGTLSGSDVTLDNLSFTPSKGYGWHLLGNPFPCPIKWNDGNWALQNVGTNAVTYNETSGNFVVLRTGDIIPSTNGFFVQVDNASNSLTIPASARTFSSANNYKSDQAGTADSCISLKVTGEANSYYDVTKVCFRGNATDGWDRNYDAHKMFGAHDAPQLWTVSNNENFALNTLPPPEGDFALPVDFRAGVNSTYHLSWSGIKNIPGNREVQLEDVLKDTTVNMRQVPGYDFTAFAIDSSGRFVLHINGTTGIPGIGTNNHLFVYALGKDVHIRANGNEMLTGEVVLYNLWGQQVYKARLNGTRQQALKTKLDAGVYVVQVKKENGTIVVKKIFIR